MKDFNAAIAALTLADVADPYFATNKLIRDIGKTWPRLKRSERRPDVIRIVEKTKLDLLISKAKGLPDDEGIRLLIEEQVAPEVIANALDITGEKLEQVNTEVEKERAEWARVATLLEAVEGKSNEEKVKHLFANNVSEKLIIEMVKVDQEAINGIKQAMEAELKEKQRLEEEAAARKKGKKFRRMRCSNTSRPFAKSWNSAIRRKKSELCASRVPSPSALWTLLFRSLKDWMSSKKRRRDNRYIRELCQVLKN
jgi:hypothetical protein